MNIVYQIYCYYCEKSLHVTSVASALIQITAFHKYLSSRFLSRQRCLIKTKQEYNATNPQVKCIR